MLTTIERQKLLDYLAKNGSDSVLLEAAHSAHRERADATAHLAEIGKGMKTIVAPVEKVVKSNAPPIPEIPIVDFFKGEMPKKLGRVGQDAVAFLKRKNTGYSLPGLRAGVDYPEGKLKPQLALAIHRGLISYANGEFKFAQQG